jgi:hypothetical protein
MAEPSSNPEPPPEPPVRWPWGARFWFLVTLLIGPAYVVWMTGVEGKRMWVVIGIMLLIALCAGIAHRLMAMTRK